MNEVQNAVFELLDKVEQEPQNKLNSVTTLLGKSRNEILSYIENNFKDNLTEVNIITFGTSITQNSVSVKTSFSIENNEISTSFIVTVGVPMGLINSSQMLQEDKFWNLIDLINQRSTFGYFTITKIQNARCDVSELNRGSIYSVELLGKISMTSLVEIECQDEQGEINVRISKARQCTC